MKQILFILLFTCLAFSAQAQFGVGDRGKVPCKEQVFLADTAFVSFGDTATIFTVFSFNVNGIPLFTVDTLVVLDTVIFADTLTLAPGATYHVGKRMIICDSTGCDTFLTVLTPVLVTPACVLPTISSVGSGIPSQNGGIQVVQYGAGNDSALISVFASPGNTNFSTPFLVDSFWVVGNSVVNYNFTIFPQNYDFSYVFVIKNSLGSDTTNIHWMHTLGAAGSPWVGNFPDSLSIGQTTVSAYWSLLTNNLLTTVVKQWRLNGASSWLNLPAVNFPANASANAVNFSLGSLTANTSYEMRLYATNSMGSDTSGIYVFTTASTPAQFTLSADSSYVFNFNTEHIMGTVTVPGASADVYWVLTTFADVNYANVLQTSPLISFTGGIWQSTFDATPLTVGGHYRVSLVGVSGATVISVGQVEYTFYFMGTPPTVDNVVFTNITPLTAVGTVTATTLAAGTMQMKWGSISGNFPNTLPVQNLVTGTNSKVSNFVGLPYNDTVFVQIVALTTVSGLTDTAWTFFVTTDTTVIAPLFPEITQTGAISVTDSSAQVEVVVDGHGSSTSTIVEWGVNGSTYPFSAPAQGGSGGLATLYVNLANLTANTTYYVRITATSVGGVDVKYFSFSTLPAVVEIDEEDSVPKVNVYPNPTTNLIYIKGYEGLVVLMNVQGQLIAEGEISQRANMFDVQNVSEGIYFLIFKTGESRKVIIER